MLRGIVNESLLPIVPVSVKKLDGDWQKLNVLCDTGADGGLVLGRATLSRHGVAIAPDRNALATIDPADLPGDSISVSHYWVELEGYPRLVEAEIREKLRFCGLIGTDLLQGRRITMDVRENGTVNIDRTPSPSRRRSGLRKSQLQHRSSEYPPLSMKLPWADVTIKDGEGRCQTISANVDTGTNGELTLPPSDVERLGLRLLDKCRVNTINGEVNASCGEVEIVWQGCHRTVQCIQREDVDRPIIGMKLLSCNRITIDFEPSGASVRIAPIKRQSYADRLRHRFAGLLRWRGRASCP